MANKNILLIEPGYRNKYPPLGLMKIAQYHGPNGKNDFVKFIKGEDKSVLDTSWHRVYVTTLFSFEWDRTSRAIDFALKVARGQANKVFVGGIAASLMNQRFVETEKWRGVRFIPGLLDKAPALSLQLDTFEEELYSDDIRGMPIEELVPDYSILSQVSYEYPVNDAYFLYASRGCIRTCNFCGVPKLEGGLRETPSLTHIVKEIDRLYGVKKDITFMDNNFTASPRFNDLISEIIDLGFERGATLRRGRHNVLRRVDFNQGVDARELAKNENLMKQLSRICINPLRIAFDHLGLRKPYETSVRMAAANGITALSNYMLYNYLDGPEDLYERLNLNVRLNEELGIRIFSFPMRYQPVDLIDRSHVGKHWTKYQLRSMQVILQATHGIASGSPTFFREAFGGSLEDFEKLLVRPHHMIFNRMWYQEGRGNSELEDYHVAFRKLSKSQIKELLALLSDVLFDGPNSPRLSAPELKNMFAKYQDPIIGAVLKFYIPLSKSQERKIWNSKKPAPKVNFGISSDQLVEDAGLDSEEHNLDGITRVEQQVA